MHTQRKSDNSLRARSRWQLKRGTLGRIQPTGTMTRILGVDGCRTGWIAVQEDTLSGRLSWYVKPTLRELLYTEAPPSVVAIDVPIGLPDVGSRQCDILARRLLTRIRASSVFPAPLRAVTQSQSHADASAARRHLEGKGMSIQAWSIVPKIREVDELLRGNPGLLQSVVEVHPEVCFYHLAGRPMTFAKKRPQGRAERLAALQPIFNEFPAAAVRELRAEGAAADDVLDAFAALWTARRVKEGTAIILPESPPRDACGLPMQMVA